MNQIPIVHQLCQILINPLDIGLEVRIDYNNELIHIFTDVNNKKSVPINPNTMSTLDHLLQFIYNNILYLDYTYPKFKFDNIFICKNDYHYYDIIEHDDPLFIKYDTIDKNLYNTLEIINLPKFQGTIELDN